MLPASLARRARRPPCAPQTPPALTSDPHTPRPRRPPVASCEVPRTERQPLPPPLTPPPTYPVLAGEGLVQVLQGKALELDVRVAHAVKAAGAVLRGDHLRPARGGPQVGRGAGAGATRRPQSGRGMLAPSPPGPQPQNSGLAAGRFGSKPATGAALLATAPAGCLRGRAGGPTANCAWPACHLVKIEVRQAVHERVGHGLAALGPDGVLALG